jgi:serine phosphatase RsbU (regulator of sigma subunit)
MSFPEVNLRTVIGRGDGGSEERLRRMELVTDAKLSALSVEDQLDELLSRVRDELHVDTVAMFLLDVHAWQLVPTAAKGLEAEAGDGFRMSAGRGLAGRVVREAQPVVIDDITPDDVANPILLDRGIRSLVGVPLLAGGELIGVLHVGSRARRTFNSHDIQLLQLAADRLGTASQARSHKIDRLAALALQRSLLPTRLPRVPGVDLAARYVPGHTAGVGGDWYDVFTLPSGSLGVVIGDVSGHGLPSAVVMGRLRSALRAYALICDDPADALTHLDRKMHHFEAGSLATTLYAMIAPSRASLRVSIAGHPRPVLATPWRAATMLAAPVDPPLGIGRSNHRRRVTTLEFPPDAVLVCYTDGLVERRGEFIDVGLEQLRAAVRPGPAEEVCATVLATVAVDQPADDIALLAVRRLPAST